MTRMASPAPSGVRRSIDMPRLLMAAMLVGCALSGCGGSDSGSSMSPGTQYDFQAPTAGATSTYSHQFIDNSNNTLNLMSMYSVVSVNADGSFVEHYQTSGGGITTNGTQYGGADDTYMYDASGGLVSENDVEGGGTITCTYSPTQIVLPFPLYVGKTWTGNWTTSCSDGVTHISALTGGVVDDVESITVPAGTFNALKLQYQIVRTNPKNSIVETRLFTEWRDTASNRLLKAQTAYSFNVPPNGANGYVVSETLELTSHTP